MHLHEQCHQWLLTLRQSVQIINNTLFPFEFPSFPFHVFIPRSQGIPRIPSIPSIPGIPGIPSIPGIPGILSVPVRISNSGIPRFPTPLTN